MKTAAIILAAGQGTRMKSGRAKVLHTLGGRPIIRYVIDQALALKADPVIVVVGHQGEQVIEYSEQVYGHRVQFVWQKEQLGTAHAVMQAKKALSGFDGQVIILYGDVPLLGVETTRELVRKVRRTKTPVGFLSSFPPDPSGYGRVVRKNGKIVRIVEHRDASPEELGIGEVNVGTYSIDCKYLFSHLGGLGAGNNQKEYYLTDLVAIAASEGHKVASVEAAAWEMEGINSRVQLAGMEARLQNIINTRHMENGVSIINPATVRIEYDVRIGHDTLIHPFVSLHGETVVGENCIINQGAVITDSVLMNGAQIHPYSVITEAEVGPEAQVGPFGRLRPGAKLLRKAKVGNFTEVKNSILREGVKANHLSYLGDADIGEGTNVGAGTITCNFDGYNKWKTIVGKEVLIGSDCQLIAPCEVPERAVLGAGTSLDKRTSMEPGDLIITRPQSTIIKGFRDKLEKDSARIKAERAAAKAAAEKKAGKKDTARAKKKPQKSDSESVACQ